MKKCKKVTKVKTKTCEYNKAEMTWSSTDGVSVCVGPEGNAQQQMQDTDLNSLFDADLEVNHFAQGSRWLRLETVMDSGAAESIAPPSVAPWVKIEESDGSRRGQTYLSASGDRLPNLGEKKLDVTTSGGQAATATYQVADVTRALCAVSRICDKGNTVTFQAEGGFIENPDGVRTHFRRENNVYVMDLYVKEPLSQPVFGRQS